MKMKREIIAYGDYFHLFFKDLSEPVQDKIEFVFNIIRISELIPLKFFKHIENTNGLYEIRIEMEGNIYRVFCCFDRGRLVVLFHGFQKKTEKTSSREIKKAEKLKNEYFAKKKGN